jgi:2-methylaconitate cis-trans-isomerase PrpF
VQGHGTFEVSMVDASNACVFVRAADIGLNGTEMPADIEANAKVMATLAAIRLAASVRMGVEATLEDAARNTPVPFVGFVAAPATAKNLAGTTIPADDVDLVARIVSNGQLHRALPLGASMCMAVAAGIGGSVANRVTRGGRSAQDALRISMPSGVLQVAAEVRQQNGVWNAVRGSFYRTQRRLFDGHVWVRGAAFAR